MLLHRSSRIRCPTDPGIGASQGCPTGKQHEEEHGVPQARPQPLPALPAADQAERLPEHDRVACS